MQLPQLKKDDVTEKLSFAERRLHELFSLNDGDLPGADSSMRQQLVQEFFFHLVSATEVLAQFVNEVRKLGIEAKDASVPLVSNRLSHCDPIKARLASLHTATRGQPLPSNPYDDDGYIFRILNYRHQVTHRRRNPFFFSIYLGSASSRPHETLLMLDPRDPNCGPSNRPAQDELRYMFQLVESRCKDILALL